MVAKPSQFLEGVYSTKNEFNYDKMIESWHITMSDTIENYKNKKYWDITEV